MRIDLVLTLAAVFATVALVSGSLTTVALARLAPERRRLRQMRDSAIVTVEPTNVLIEAPSPAMKRLSGILPQPSKNSPRLKHRLVAAGFDDAGAVVLYSALQLVTPVVFGLIPLLVLGLRVGWFFGIAAAFVGYSAPDLLVARRITRNRKAIQDGLPDALDLIVICVEAGSSLDHAILKASTELEIAVPAIARELRTVATEVRAGKPRVQAFQDLAKRTGIDEIKALVSMLVQTDRFGTSIAQSLRTHADTSRTKRRQRAEERASTIGVRLVFPLALCLIPALYVVCLGPVVVSMFRALYLNYGGDR